MHDVEGTLDEEIIFYEGDESGIGVRLNFGRGTAETVEPKWNPKEMIE